ncbi:MAG: EAL domain-containing protein [Betaproteobacteria bacterium]
MTWWARLAAKPLLPGAFVYLFGFLTLAAVAATVYHATRLRDETLRSQREFAQNLARVGEHELTLNLRMVDRLLEARAAQWQAGSRDAGAFELQLRADLDGAPVLRSLSLVDDSGLIEASSIPGAAGRRLDGTALGALRGPANAPDVFISRPWRGRDLVDGHAAEGAIDARDPFFFTVTRRGGAATARLLSVAVLNADFIADFHTTLVVRPEYAFEVYRYDGIRLTSTQPRRSPPGGDASAEPVFSRLLADREIGLVETEGPGPDVEPALLAFRASRIYPVVVQVRMPHDAILANWRDEMRQLAVATGVTIAFILMLAIPLYRHQVQSREAESRLRQSEQHLRCIIDLVPHFIFAKNALGEFILANQAVADAYGTTVEKLTGKTDADFNCDSGQVSRFVEDDQEVIRSGTRKIVPEEVITDAAGRKRYLQTTKIPFFTPDEGEAAVLGVASDITERKEAQRLQTALYGISEAAHNARDLPDLFARIHAIVGELLPARNLFVALYDPERDEVSFPYFIDEHDPVPEPRRLAAGGLTEAVIRTGVALLVTPERMARMVADGQSIIGTDSLDWLGVPLKTDRRTIGVLTVQSYTGLVRYTARDQALLQFVSDQVATAIERKQAEQALHAGEERYRSVIAAMAEGIVVRDRDACVVDCNASAERTLGESLAQMKARGATQPERTLYREDGAAISAEESATLAALQTGRPQSNVVTGFLKPDGTMMWLSLNAQPLHDEAGTTITGVVTTFTDITEKKESEALIWQQANFDSLTQLPNRRMFRDRLEQAIKKCRRDDSKLAILFIDLDRFKEINDAFGHDKGDILLVEAARRISDCVRDSDTVARLGGDEFTVILSELEDAAGVELIAEKIIAGLAAPYWFGAEQAFVSASVGITIYPSDATGVEDLLKHADQALYVAKGAGRNRFGYFTPALQVAAQARMRLTSDLRHALEDGQFSVQFQPMVHLATGGIHRAEALLRWTHPQRGQVSPAEFIPVAEASGLIIDIGDWVFREAARWVARWRRGCHSNFQVSVNQSPLEFQGERNMHAGWLEHLQALDLPGRSIVIEITEGLLLDASTTVTDELLRLRAAGMQVAIDDFGIGYSSLVYLKKFHIDYLKIDQSFVRNLAVGSSDMALSEAIIVMAHKLGLKVIAEGVETAEQRDLLLAAGCDYGQGYLFGRPLSGEAFERLLHAVLPVN